LCGQKLQSLLRMKIIFWFCTGFAGAEFSLARRAEENSPAIYRRGTVAIGKVPQGRQDTCSSARQQ
jgi:hypothetical protein